MARVYVSSTIADLKRERRAVMDWLVAAGHQPVHSYRPDSHTVQASCLGDVASCDLYVLIVGHRYGSQPAEGNPEGLSITHLEYRQAGQAGIPRVALVRTSIPDVSVSDMENPERATLVLAFRAQVVREVRAAEFHDKGGLLRGLSTGVQGELAKLASAAAGPQLSIRAAALADEAAFSMAARDWVNGAPDPDWVLEQVHEALDQPVLIPLDQAHRARTDAESAHAEYSRPKHEAEYERRITEGDYRARHPGYVLLEQVLRPVIRVLRPESDYLEALRALPPGYAAHALKTGYRRKAPVDDFWAYDYLLILADLGETDTLMPLLESRLRDPSITMKAAEATCHLAQSALGQDSFRSWFDKLRNELDGI